MNRATGLHLWLSLVPLLELAFSCLSGQKLDSDAHFLLGKLIDFIWRRNAPYFLMPQVDEIASTLQSFPAIHGDNPKVTMVAKFFMFELRVRTYIFFFSLTLIMLQPAARGRPRRRTRQSSQASSHVSLEELNNDSKSEPEEPAIELSPHTASLVALQRGRNALIDPSSSDPEATRVAKKKSTRKLKPVDRSNWTRHNVPTIDFWKFYNRLVRQSVPDLQDLSFKNYCSDE
jgi:hypothetical protein